MSQLPLEVAEEIAREQQHFAAAPDAFFKAWKRGVQIAGPRWFGDGTQEGFEQARDKWALCPDMPRISKALGVLSAGERMFLAAMVSFYNAHRSAPLLRRCGFEGLSDLSGLDLARRQVIASLVLHYNGW
ncbi:hypothetical protein QRD40_05110 [Comamonas sp. Y6]|uniref:Uncharacterized protein n=1 Tax=Comamonas resistens TaxID=3046670 RepID=A0ABY8SPZ1_9BURK|nr:hypothetical protein [Comamonas resistens]MDL5035727.1 hypothetical protein [Comamonas resistens]WHS65142.1 hypothetical protein QMY55_22080 [Comamonas resistens]HBP0979071.1 hypothetical protein [Pseudomonas aeruginosa]